MMQQPSTIRGSIALPDRCPEHDSIVVWYAEPEVMAMQWMTWLQVARYDCGCIVTSEFREMGAPAVRESIVPTDETVGE